MQLELKDVSFSYGRFSFSKKPELTIRNVNLYISNSKVVSLIGCNGAGKTTLLNLIGGLTKPSFGEIIKEGVEKISFISQMETEINWMPITVREILKMSSYRSRGYFKRLTLDNYEIIKSSAERMEVTDLLDEQFSSLSKGERQRVKISLALAQEPDLLVMDEPLNGLDLLSQERIQKAVQEEKIRGAGVVIATHSLEEAGQADEVVLLDKGVVAQGEPQKILTEENLRRVYKDQLKMISEDKFIVVDHH